MGVFEESDQRVELEETVTVADIFSTTVYLTRLILI